ncbi:endonuclease/exonuclease/phosphatase family protein [Phaeacidiphilus oryzae]|uniref:endonuclease/exonuclease/phosphatase family protein n=1 Tax=Phaeacidiphilus oryzae TaxID=348818 RepID=UPI0005621911|nr:endonuclease/exonuclease/phosphatase family protein [Phaeacidiphilus oryzae]
MRIATFNLLHGQPLSGGRPLPFPDPDGEGGAGAPLAEAVRALDADVLALQEVDRFQARSGLVDQPAVAAEALGAADWRFAAALHGEPAPVSGWVLDPDHADLRVYGPGPGLAPGLEPGLGLGEDPAETPVPSYGTALLTRLPVRHWRARRFAPAPFGLPLRVAGRAGLTPVPDEPRAALAAVLEGAEGPFTVVAAHLSFVPGWNMGQLAAIRRWIADLPAPYLLLGDLNLVGAVPRTVLGGAEVVDSVRRRGRQKPGASARRRARLRTRRAEAAAGAPFPLRSRGVNPRTLLRGWRDLARLPTYPAHRPAVQFDHVLAVGVPRDAVRAARTPPTPISDHRPLVVELDL